MSLATHLSPHLGRASSTSLRFTQATLHKSQTLNPRLLRNTRAFSSSSPNLDPRLTGRTCMITGGSSGIGYAIAERFLQEGAERVILVGRSYKRLLDASRRLDPGSRELSTDKDVATRTPEEDRQLDIDTGCTESQTASDVKQNGALVRSSERISLLVGDVADIGGWMKVLEGELESTDVLINAAGLSISKVLAKSEPEDISLILRTNLEAAILTSRALLRASIRARIKNRKSPSSENKSAPSKCIINISSLLAMKSGSGAVPYAASKAGLLGLTRSLAVESAATLKDVVVRSNAIVPGYIETPMIADFSEGETTRLKESIPLRRFGDPREVADAAVFLAQNEYANNCVLNLDGGLSAV